MSARKLALLISVAILSPATTSHATPPVGLLDEAATASAVAIRLDPPDPPAPLSNEDIIRAVWPDNLEDRAVRIAYRESRLTNHVRTWCCFGLMQIHKIHLRWLGPLLGIWTVEQLYDPWLNAQAGYALYQRDGWSPWATS